MKGWKIATIVVGIFSMSFLIVIAILGVANFYLNQQMIEFRDQNVNFQKQIDGKDTQINQLKNQLTVLPPENLTYEELMEFLKRDKTDEKEFIPYKYEALDFARELRENAQKEGIRTGLIALSTKEFTFYINVFETADKGLIYINPQGDEIVTVRRGESYWEQNGWERPSLDDTILKVYDPIW